jgi:transcriptional regulator with XRE-family HTH domain
MNISEHTLKLLQRLGERIKKARLDNHMSQVELAEKIGVTRYTIATLESGSEKVAIGTVFEAALAVGLSLDAAKLEDINEAIMIHNPPRVEKLDDDYF